MSNLTSEIQLIPIDQIAVLNPRGRNRKVFKELVTSIAHLGLKKPITVSQRADGGYDLVCGQGRMEAFRELGESLIPARVIEASQEDCFIMSLVENLARRQHTPMELIKEIGTLRDRGYSKVDIAKKTDFSEEYVFAILYLLDHGEERILTAVEKGIIPASIAMEIARAQDGDVQQALADAYEQKIIPGKQVMAIRKIIEQRNLTGKSIHSIQTQSHRPRRKVTATTLIRAYRKETERQRQQVRKATITQQRLLFVVNALRHLLEDENFRTLLRAEGVHSLPGPLSERLDGRLKL
ncbi:MAG: ParB N-terminal domain-containing protein [Proteobacteria bacterium]|nr:ParB N-terminal domain-containing protein [Pseudomonadota bacterium]